LDNLTKPINKQNYDAKEEDERRSRRRKPMEFNRVQLDLNFDGFIIDVRAELHDVVLQVDDGRCKRQAIDGWQRKARCQLIGQVTHPQ
jgi:hypothetical protein